MGFFKKWLLHNFVIAFLICVSYTVLPLAAAVPSNNLPSLLALTSEWLPLKVFSASCLSDSA